MKTTRLFLPQYLKVESLRSTEWRHAISWFKHHSLPSLLSFNIISFACFLCLLISVFLFPLLAEFHSRLSFNPFLIWSFECWTLTSPLSILTLNLSESVDWFCLLITEPDFRSLQLLLCFLKIWLCWCP